MCLQEYCIEKTDGQKQTTWNVPQNPGEKKFPQPRILADMLLNMNSFDCVNICLSASQKALKPWRSSSPAMVFLSFPTSPERLWSLVSAAEAGMGRDGGRATAPCLAEVCVESQGLDLLLRWQHVLFPYKALTLTVWKPAAKQTDAAAMPGIEIFSLALLHVHSPYKLSERRHITRASMQARCDVRQNIGIASLLWFNPTNDSGHLNNVCVVILRLKI